MRRNRTSRRRKLLQIETLESRLVLADVMGVINSNTTWVASESPYRLVGDVMVQNGATLTIEPGVRVLTTFGAFYDLGISANGSGGTLNADGAVFDAVVTFGQNGGGTIRNSSVASWYMSVTNNANPQFINTTFHNQGSTSFQSYPEYIPQLLPGGNTFAPGATVGVLGGVIDTDTVWPKLDDAGRYQVTSDVFVRNGASLTIASGMELFDNSGFVELHISDNGSGGSLMADGVTFTGDVIFGQNASGTIQNSSVASNRIAITSNANPILSANSFHSARPLEVYPEFVPNVAGRGNVFDTGATIGVFGGEIDVDTVWPNIDDASRYELFADVFVRSGATLTIGSGMTLFDNSGFVELYISDDGSGGVLIADGVSFNADVIFGQDSTGTISNGNVSGKRFAINGNAAPVITDTSFHSGRPLEVYPEYVPNIDGRGNLFDTGATIGVFGGEIDVDTVWPNIDDASRYELFADVFVRSGATLTIGSGMTLFDNSGFVELYISDDGSGGALVADGVSFNADVIFGQDSTGAINDGNVSGKRFAVNGNAAPIITNTSFHSGRPLEVVPKYVPELAGRGNTFDDNATVGVLTGVIDQPTTWPNLNGAATYELLGDVFVRGNSVLTIEGGMRLFDNSGFIELFVSDDGLGAGLNANGVTFDADVIFGQNAIGTIQNSAISSHAHTVNNGANPSYFGNSFHSGTPISVVPSYVPRLLNNNFAFGATVNVLEGQVASDLTWPNVPGVTTFALAGDVHVTSDAALTIARGLVVEALSSFNELFVGALGFGGTLNAEYVVFDTEVIFGSLSSGTIENSRFLSSVDLDGQTQAGFVSNHFGGATVVRAILNTFGTIDLTNNFWGTNNSATIENKIDHQPDNPSRPLVLFAPFNSTPPQRANPVITWPDPADIPVGVALGPDQLNATANTSGTFVYTPPLGAVLGPGDNQQLGVVFTPSNTLTFNSATDTAEIDVVRANPVITWADPAGIVFGTALGATQLNAEADVPGSFVYTPTLGTVLNAGDNQTLSVTFTPNDATSFNTVTSNVMIDVARADSTITWNDPDTIMFGTELSSVQLNASSNRAGTFTYTPPTGTVLSVGADQNLSVDFAPTDTQNFNAASATVTIDVVKASPVITWDDPGAILVGTPLSATQLNATATVAGESVAGNFFYTPNIGAVLAAGENQILSVNFIPSDLNNLNSVSSQVRIDVNRIVPDVTWDDPANIIFGTALSSTQLNATSDIEGTFVYDPDEGTVLDPGFNQTLAATFLPTDSATYAQVQTNARINVLKADPVITWPDPSDIVFGDALGVIQLNAAADVAGTFVYTPEAGTILDAGADQTLSVQFLPTDTTRYNPISATATIDVQKADPVITWDEPGAIFVGAPLGIDQLNATANVPGQFAYDPPAGTVLGGGVDQPLGVTFTPTDAGNYSVVSASVSIDVIDSFDYGDAPSTYGVTIADGGPRHLVGALKLGAVIDAEADGQATAVADGDDLQGDDEDGLTAVANVVATETNVNASSFLVNSSDDAKLDAWIDFNRNGQFDSNEHLRNGSSFQLVAGENLIKFFVPPGASAGDSYLRLRLSSTGGLAPTGTAMDGEVEDYPVTILDGAAGGTAVSVDAPRSAIKAVLGNNLSVSDGSDLLFRAPITSVGSISLTGGDEANVTTLEFEDGAVVPSGGLTVDGLGDIDVLEVIGPASELDLTDPNVEVTQVEIFDLTSPDETTLVIDVESIESLNVDQPPLIAGVEGDVLTIADGPNWRMAPPIETNGVFERVVEQGDTQIRVDLPHPYQNLAQQHDVSNDGLVRASDALRVINEMSSRRFSDPTTAEIPPRDSRFLNLFPSVYYDVSGDDRITALDALQVINQMTRQLLVSPGQGEWIVQAHYEGSDEIVENTPSAIEPEVLDESQPVSGFGQQQRDDRSGSVIELSDESSDSDVESTDGVFADDDFLNQFGPLR